MGSTINSMGNSLKQKVEEYRSTYDVNISYPEYNFYTRKWETSTATFTFDKSHKYSGKEIKMLMGNKMDMFPEKLLIGHGSSAWSFQNPLRDDQHYQSKTLRVAYKIQLNIKYFDTNNFNNIIYNKNYKSHTMSVPTHENTDLYPLIDADITEGNVCLGCLILQRMDSKIHLIISGYSRRVIEESPDEIICLIMRYYLSDDYVDIYGNIIKQNIAPYETLIMYKNYGHPYIDYDDIEKLTDEQQEFTVYIQNLNVLRHFNPEIDFFNFVTDKDKLGIFEDKRMDPLKLNVNDTIDDVIDKIINEVYPLYANISGLIMPQTHNTCVHFNAMTLAAGGWFSRPRRNDHGRRIIDYGVINGSIIQCYSFGRMLS